MEAKLLIGNSVENMDLYYATKFLTLIPFIYLKRGTEEIIIMPSVEVEKAKRKIKSAEVICTEEYKVRLKKDIEKPTELDCLDNLLSKLEIRDITVPAYLGIKSADYLRNKGYNLKIKDMPFFEERTVKTGEEVACITGVLRHTEHALDAAVNILKESKIEDSLLYYDNEVLTAEYIKKVINNSLWENGCIAKYDTLVACGNDGVEPHPEGKGPLRANETILIDIFPQSTETLYWGDITRTFVKGKASEEQIKIYATVRGAQKHAIEMIKDGVNGKDVHEAVINYFENQGYKIEEIDGKLQGFVHGTGHSIGLNLHESPRISKVDAILREGNVITVEPGLYYMDRGCVRIEDIIVVTKEGCNNLTQYEKVLELE